MLEHRTTPQDDHGWSLCRVASCQGSDTFSGNTGERLGPFGGKKTEVVCERLKPQGMRLNKIGVGQSFLNEYIGHRERQSRVTPRSHYIDLVGMPRCFAPTTIDMDNMRTPLASFHDIRSSRGLAGKGCPPQNNRARVGSHVLLRIG